MIKINLICLGDIKEKYLKDAILEYAAVKRNGENKEYFHTYVDAGVVFTNKSAQLSLDIPTDNLQQYNGTTWESVDIPELNAVIDKTLSDAQSELDDLKFYPMVKLGFMYRF